MASRDLGAWKKPVVNNAKRKDQTSFPDLKQSGVADTTKIEYEELQRNEIMVLEAIYGEDFVKHKDAGGAWKKSEPAFDVRIRAPSDDDVGLTLRVVMTATYPKSPPLLTIKNSENLLDATGFKVQKYMESKPKEFAKEEQEMVDRIVEGIRDILEDAAQAKAKGRQLPSLEEERAAHEAEAAKMIEAERERDERKRVEETIEEERVLGGLLQEELKRQKDRAKESRRKSKANALGHVPAMERSQTADDNHIVFDRLCRTVDRSGNEIFFHAVSNKFEYKRTGLSTLFLVHPITNSDSQERPCLILKEVRVNTAGKDSTAIKKQLLSLDSLFESLTGLSHRNVERLLDFRVDRSGPDASPETPSLWTFTMLSPFAERGSLEEYIELDGHLDVGKVRTWTRDLLDAVSYLNNKGIVHQNIHPGNILLFREPTREITPKLSDVGYQRELHSLASKDRVLPAMASAKSAYWVPPEIAATSKPHYTHKTDVWDFGVVVLQMIFGLEVVQKYHSPTSVVDDQSLSSSLTELVRKFFMKDPKLRPRAFELTSSEFLATDAPVFAEDSVALLDTVQASIHSSQGIMTRLRRESMTTRPSATSRYQEDFVEEGRLGRGGFGEVVKARKKLNGQVYAIKKISQTSGASLTEILKEVRVLPQLSHPAVVRYYDTWVEETPGHGEGDEDESTFDDETDDMNETSQDASEQPDVLYTTSTGALDFMSSTGIPQIEFGYDDSASRDDEAVEDDDDEESSSDEEDVWQPGRLVPAANKAKDTQNIFSRHGFRKVLYISMEYCEKKTLADLIARKLYQNSAEIWRLFRQILEGLVHIHGLNIVHRDLKPENIFIARGADGVDNVKIGDFGLATSGQIVIDKAAGNAQDAADLTRSVGTFLYTAPEVRSSASGSYSAKVDMYSLGIIFFEMCYPPMLGMQRAQVLKELRTSPPAFPDDFKPDEKIKTEIILSLLTHSPKDRPSSRELLHSGKLPVEMESETIRRTLSNLADEDSPYFKKMMSTLFSRRFEQAKDYAWDLQASLPSQADLLNQNMVKQALISIFRRHGALEMPRSVLYPKSDHYNDNVVTVLNPDGGVLQLPFDLTMGHARMIAKHPGSLPAQRTFTFGNVFRDHADTRQPTMIAEVDFDIVTPDTRDLALKEAEVLKVLDEIVAAFPSFSSAQMCFHLGHSELLQLIFEYCKIEASYRRATADILSKLNIHNWTWSKIRSELRAPLVGVSAFSVDELKKFDFRDTPSKAFSRLKALFEGSNMYERASSTLAHLKEVSEYSKRLGIVSKIYVCPLSSWKESLYTGGVLFSCLVDKKYKDVFAAGGRYDSLIKEFRPRVGGHVEERHAVGFNLSWERLARAVAKSGGKSTHKKLDEENQGFFSERRCDVLVASFDTRLLRSAGIDILRDLWRQNISAELAQDARSPEELFSKHREDTYSWIVMVKQDSQLKVKSLGRKDMPDIDIPTAQLLPWLRSELRERDSKGPAKPRGPVQQSEASTAAGENQEQDVRVLVAQTKSKKLIHRQNVAEQAQISAAGLVQSFLNGPILAIETTDQVMELIRDTNLSDGDSWRKLEHTVPATEKKYVKEIHGLLRNWRSGWEAKNADRHAFLYNFRTGNCLYYDLGA